jgi:hypothetical protein
MAATLSAFCEAWASILLWKDHGSLRSPWLPESPPESQALHHKATQKQSEILLCNKTNTSILLELTKAQQANTIRRINQFPRTREPYCRDFPIQAG